MSAVFVGFWVESLGEILRVLFQVFLIEGNEFWSGEALG